MHFVPIYEYRCEDCDHTFELLTSYAERDRPHVCPTCESTRTSVLVSKFASVGSATDPLAATAPQSSSCCCGGSCGCGSRN